MISFDNCIPPESCRVLFPLYQWGTEAGKTRKEVWDKGPRSSAFPMLSRREAFNWWRNCDHWLSVCYVKGHAGHCRGQRDAYCLFFFFCSTFQMWYKLTEVFEKGCLYMNCHYAIQGCPGLENIPKEKNDGRQLSASSLVIITTRKALLIHFANEILRARKSERTFSV